MKLTIGAAILASGAAFAPAFVPRTHTALNGISDDLKGIQGPEIYWGSKGIAEGFDEGDIKGYDNFDMLADALASNGIDLASGDFTLLAPSNSAIEKHNNEVGTPIDADVLKYHVIPGKVSMDALDKDQKTVNGGTLTSYRKVSLHRGKGGELVAREEANL